MGIILTILLFGVLIFIHEFGHFITAKLSGVKVNEFALGMGPVIWKTRKKDTQYALRLLPIGGWALYVANIVSLLVASAVNSIIAAIAYFSLRNTKLVRK